MKPKTLLEVAGANPAPPPLSDATIVVIDAQREYVDGKLPLGYRLPVSTVSSGKGSIPRGAHICPAPNQGNQCGSCRACWDPSVKVVIYHLKWKTAERDRGVR